MKATAWDGLMRAIQIISDERSRLNKILQQTENPFLREICSHQITTLSVIRDKLEVELALAEEPE